MRLFITVALITVNFFAFAQSRHSQLIPYRKGNLWGYSNTNKRIVIPVKFEAVSPFGYTSSCCFYENHARVQLHGVNYVIDVKGKLEDENQFLKRDEAKAPPPMQEALSVEDQQEKDGAVTLNGKIVIPANKYKSIAVLEGYNPFFIVTNSNNLSGVIDRQQKLILPLQYHGIVYFFLNEYYDSTLHQLVKPAYFTFNEPGKKEYVIAKYQDSIVKKVTVQYCKKLNDYIAFAEPGNVISYNSNWGILDRNLNLKVKPKYAEISEESFNDIFLVRIYNYDEKKERLEDKIGYIDVKGTEFFE